MMIMKINYYNNISKDVSGWGSRYCRKNTCIGTDLDFLLLYQSEIFILANFWITVHKLCNITSRLYLKGGKVEHTKWYVSRPILAIFGLGTSDCNSIIIKIKLIAKCTRACLWCRITNVNNTIALSIK